MNELLVQLQMKMEAFQKDAALQAEKGNKAAGQRARCVSLEMEPLLKQFRKLSLAASKKIKSKTLRGCHSSAMKKQEVLMPFIHAHQDFFCCISKPCLSVSFLPESVLLRYGSAGEAVPVPDSLAGKPSLR